jgi:hypothetical protein
VNKLFFYLVFAIVAGSVHADEHSPELTIPAELSDKVIYQGEVLSSHYDKGQNIYLLLMRYGDNLYQCNVLQHERICFRRGMLNILEH